jgi:hypothetical protein
MLAAIVLTPLCEFGIAGGNEGVATHAGFGGGVCAQGLFDLTHLLVDNLVWLRLLVRRIHLCGLGPPNGGTLPHVRMVLPSRNSKAIIITDSIHVGSLWLHVLPCAQRTARGEEKECGRGPGLGSLTVFS